MNVCMYVHRSISIKLQVCNRNSDFVFGTNTCYVIRKLTYTVSSNTIQIQYIKYNIKLLRGSKATVDTFFIG